MRPELSAALLITALLVLLFILAIIALGVLVPLLLLASLPLAIVIALAARLFLATLIVGTLFTIIHGTLPYVTPAPINRLAGLPVPAERKNSPAGRLDVHSLNRRVAGAFAAVRR